MYSTHHIFASPKIYVTKTYAPLVVCTSLVLGHAARVSRVRRLLGDPFQTFIIHRSPLVLYNIHAAYVHCARLRRAPHTHSFTSLALHIVTYPPRLFRMQSARFYIHANLHKTNDLCAHCVSHICCWAPIRERKGNHRAHNAHRRGNKLQIINGPRCAVVQ